MVGKIKREVTSLKLEMGAVMRLAPATDVTVEESELGSTSDSATASQSSARYQ